MLSAIKFDEHRFFHADPYGHFGDMESEIAELRTMTRVTKLRQQIECRQEGAWMMVRDIPDDRSKGGTRKVTSYGRSTRSVTRSFTSDVDFGGFLSNDGPTVSHESDNLRGNKVEAIVEFPDDYKVTSFTPPSAVEITEVLDDEPIDPEPNESDTTYATIKTSPTKKTSVVTLGQGNVVLIDPQDSYFKVTGLSKERDDDISTQKPSADKGDKRVKKVEFCKTEVHFAPDSGRVKIVETDEKPPSSQVLRRKKKPRKEGSTKSSMPKLYFGDSEKGRFLNERDPTPKEELSVNRVAEHVFSVIREPSPLLSTSIANQARSELKESWSRVASPKHDEASNSFSHYGELRKDRTRSSMKNDTSEVRRDYSQDRTRSSFKSSETIIPLKNDSDGLRRDHSHDRTKSSVKNDAGEFKRDNSQDRTRNSFKSSEVIIPLKNDSDGLRRDHSHDRSRNTLKNDTGEFRRDHSQDRARNSFKSSETIIPLRDDSDGLRRDHSHDRTRNSLKNDTGEFRRDHSQDRTRNSFKSSETIIPLKNESDGLRRDHSHDRTRNSLKNDTGEFRRDHSLDRTRNSFKSSETIIPLKNDSDGLRRDHSHDRTRNSLKNDTGEFRRDHSQDRTRNSFKSSETIIPMKNDSGGLGRDRFQDSTRSSFKNDTDELRRDHSQDRTRTSFKSSETIIPLKSDSCEPKGDDARDRTRSNLVDDSGEFRRDRTRTSFKSSETIIPLSDTAKPYLKDPKNIWAKEGSGPSKPNYLRNVSPKLSKLISNNIQHEFQQKQMQILRKSRESDLMQKQDSRDASPRQDVDSTSTSIVTDDSIPIAVNIHVTSDESPVKVKPVKIVAQVQEKGKSAPEPRTKRLISEPLYANNDASKGITRTINISREEDTTPKPRSSQTKIIVDERKRTKSLTKPVQQPEKVVRKSVPTPRPREIPKREVAVVKPMKPYTKNTLTRVNEPCKRSKNVTEVHQDTQTSRTSKVSRSTNDKNESRTKKIKEPLRSFEKVSNGWVGHCIVPLKAAKTSSKINITTASATNATPLTVSSNNQGVKGDNEATESNNSVSVRIENKFQTRSSLTSNKQFSLSKEHLKSAKLVKELYKGTEAHVPDASRPKLNAVRPRMSEEKQKSIVSRRRLVYEEGLHRSRRDSEQSDDSVVRADEEVRAYMFNSENKVWNRNWWRNYIQGHSNLLDAKQRVV